MKGGCTMNELHELDEKLDKLRILYNEWAMYGKRVSAETSDINGMCISKIKYEDDFGMIMEWALVNGIPVGMKYLNI